MTDPHPLPTPVAASPSWNAASEHPAVTLLAMAQMPLRLAEQAAPYVQAAFRLAELVTPYVQAGVHLAERAAPLVEVFQQAALRVHPYAAAIAGRIAAWEELAAPALLRVAPLLERAYAAAQSLQALAESRTHQACFRAAEAVDVNDKDAVIRFTVEVLRLHPDLWPVAAEVLALTNDWWWATDPIRHLRREVRAYAGRIDWADRDHRRRTVPFGEAETRADPNGDFARQQVEVVHDVAAAFSRAGLRTETSLVLAALEDHDRVSAARALKVSTLEVDAGWKRVHRKRGELARLLKP